MRQNFRVPSILMASKRDSEKPEECCVSRLKHSLSTSPAVLAELLQPLTSPAPLNVALQQHLLPRHSRAGGEGVYIISRSRTLFSARC